MTSLFDIEALAKRNLTPDYWDWISSGYGEGMLVRRNQEAFEEIRIRPRPRVLMDASKIDTSTTVLGERIELPVFASPAGTQWIAHTDAEVAVARGVGSAGTLMTLATGAHKTTEEVAEAARGPLWFQLYHLTDDITGYMLSKVESLGYSAICLTLGNPSGRRRKAGPFSGYSPSGDLAWGDLVEVPDLRRQINNLDRSSYNIFNLETVEWLRNITSLPLVIKEIMTPQDARRCVDYGASGIVVSNHGGRTSDTGQASIEALSAIVEEVGDEIEVYLDSGVRSGSDIFKALAIGARAVGVGRPVIWGLALDGHNGVNRVFEILRDEFERAMSICGCISVTDIDTAVIVSLKGNK